MSDKEDFQMGVEKISALTGISQGEIIYIIEQMQHAYHDEQERQYREMKEKNDGKP